VVNDVCGRFFLASPGHALAEHFGVPGLGAMTPRYNIIPPHLVPAVAEDESGARALRFLKWGLVPRWATEPRHAPTNARVETAADNNFFAESFRLRRCLVPADGYYRWSRPGRNRRPLYFRPWDEQPLAIGAVWDVWDGPAGPFPTLAVLTTRAGCLMRQYHKRMPVIVARKDYGLWLSRDVQDPAELAAALRPIPSDLLRAFPGGPDASDPQDEAPELVAEAGVNRRARRPGSGRRGRHMARRRRGRG
jgi:putative SOS response-associated peptidase YedK